MSQTKDKTHLPNEAREEGGSEPVTGDSVNISDTVSNIDQRKSKTYQDLREHKDGSEHTIAQVYEPDASVKIPARPRGDTSPYATHTKASISKQNDKLEFSLSKKATPFKDPHTEGGIIRPRSLSEFTIGKSSILRQPTLRDVDENSAMTHRPRVLTKSVRPRTADDPHFEHSATPDQHERSAMGGTFQVEQVDQDKSVETSIRLASAQVMSGALNHKPVPFGSSSDTTGESEGRNDISGHFGLGPWSGAGDRMEHRDSDQKILREKLNVFFTELDKSKDENKTSNGKLRDVEAQLLELQGKLETVEHLPVGSRPKHVELEQRYATLLTDYDTLLAQNRHKDPLAEQECSNSSTKHMILSTEHETLSVKHATQSKKFEPFHIHTGESELHAEDPERV